MCGCQWREGLVGSGLMHQTYPLVNFPTMIRVKPLGIKLGTIFENDVPHGRIILSHYKTMCYISQVCYFLFQGDLDKLEKEIKDHCKLKRESSDVAAVMKDDNIYLQVNNMALSFPPNRSLMSR